MNSYYLFEDYNIIVYNYNSIFHKALFSDYSDFLEKFNFVPNKFNRDVKSILTHLILTQLINLIQKHECNTIIMFNKNLNFDDFYVLFEKELFDSFILNILFKISKKFNIPIVEMDEFNRDVQTTYRLKLLIDNKKCTNLKKIKKFLSENNLKFLEKFVSTNRTIQLKLSK